MVNIFYTDHDPKVAARDSCDSYVVKIPVEVGLLLSAIHWRTCYKGPISSGLPLVLDAEGCVLPAIGPYKDSKVIKSTSETYKWLIKSTGNYDYAITYGLELISEFKKRYGKLHQTESVLLWLKVNVPNIPTGPTTEDVGLAMPDKYKDRSNPTASYKNYIMCEKSAVVSWKRSKIPDWYGERFVYTDGAASGNGTDNCRAGYAVWFGDNDPRNSCGAVSKNPSNQTAELSAIKKAVEIIGSEKYTIVTDSKYCIDCITKWIHKWNSNGWRTSNNEPVKHKNLIMETARMLGDSRLLHIRGHTAQPDINSEQWKHWNGNRQADLLASTAALKWCPHPEDKGYVYTTDIELGTGYPLKNVMSGRVVATIDNDGVYELSTQDLAAARKYCLPL